jgi:hypothetical protein
MPPNFQYDDGAGMEAGGPNMRANWSPYVRPLSPTDLHIFFLKVI